jgi:phosphate starvation-inducible PhoH-like protein
MKNSQSRKIARREIRSERRKDKQKLHLRPEEFSNDEFFQPISQVKKEVKPLKALTPRQELYLQLIKNNVITFATGPAGTGKTFVAAAHAAEQLRDGEIERIIITRPAVECGESFGFLPGELEEKYEPYIEPFRDVFNKRLGKSQVNYFMTHGQIIAKPLSFMRGSNFNDCVVILDEAQNTTPEQMKMFLTRINENCKVIIDGDLEQCDVSGTSGLRDALYRMRNVANVGFVEFKEEDIVRHGIVRDIIRAYNTQ